MKFSFSLKVTLFCGILAALMLYASYWQYTRYIAKLAYIEELDSRLKMPVQALTSIWLKNSSPEEILHRRVTLKGTWDYDHEIILRNRKMGEVAGAHVITPLLIDGMSEKRVLISRGFLPLSATSPKDRLKFHNGPAEVFIALVKETSPQKLFAPQDPESGLDKPWVDAWLRIDIPSISKQLPYSVLPFYLEMMSRDSSEVDSNKFIQQKDERDQILFLPGAGASLNSVKKDLKETDYPVPVFDTVVPAGRHYSYIFEWAIMAFGVSLTGLGLQLRQRSELKK